MLMNAAIPRAGESKIDDAPARDSQPLPLTHLERRPGILRHDLTLQEGHPVLLVTQRLPSNQIIPLPYGLVNFAELWLFPLVCSAAPKTILTAAEVRQSIPYTTAESII